MPKKARSTAPRFSVDDSVDDKVDISSVIHSALSGRRGVVIEVHRNRHAQNLDRYLVVVQGATEPTLLWGIELKGARGREPADLDSPAVQSTARANSSSPDK